MAKRKSRSKTKAGPRSRKSVRARSARAKAPDRLPAVEKVFGGLPVLPERGFDPGR